MSRGSGDVASVRTGVSSSRIVFLTLRTAYSAGLASATLTRATDLPSVATACSSVTLDTGSRR